MWMWGLWLFSFINQEMFLVAGGFGVWLAGPLEFLINFMVMSLPYSYGWLSLLLSGACLVISLHVGCPSFCVMVEWATV